MSGHRPGSRAHALAQLAPGESTLFEVPAGRTVAALMQSLVVDARRAGIVMRQAHLLAIQPHSRAVFDIVRVTRETGESDKSCNPQCEKSVNFTGDNSVSGAASPPLSEPCAQDPSDAHFAEHQQNRKI